MNYPISWASGLFEGEGTVFYSPSRNGVSLSISMTDERPIRAFATLFSMGVRKMRLRRHYKQVWKTETRSRVKIASIFKQFLPWLSPRRVAQFNKALGAVKKIRVMQGETYGQKCSRSKSKSQAGYRWHKNNGQKPCCGCLIEYQKYMRAYRAAK